MNILSTGLCCSGTALHKIWQSMGFFALKRFVRKFVSWHILHSDGKNFYTETLDLYHYTCLAEYKFQNETFRINPRLRETITCLHLSNLVSLQPRSCFLHKLSSIATGKGTWSLHSVTCSQIRKHLLSRAVLKSCAIKIEYGIHLIYKLSIT